MFLIENHSVTFSDEIVTIVAEKGATVDELLGIIGGHLFFNVDRLAWFGNYWVGRGCGFRCILILFTGHLVGCFDNKL